MKLSVVIGTYNRLEQLKRCIDSIFRETVTPVKVYVTDAGSTDGTVEYLQQIASEKVEPHLIGKKLGQAKAYNEVFKIVATPYICWLSDDNEVVNGSLDIAVRALEKNPRMGMIGLKVKDLQGPFIKSPYIGGISTIGILNVNQGVLPTDVMHHLNGFSEEFRDYGIDPDLTARVLFAGYKIAYTKEIALLHYRNWSENKQSPDYKLIREKHDRYYDLYEKKFKPYADLWYAGTSCINLNRKIKNYLIKGKKVRIFNKKKITRDIYNIVNGKYINLFDLIINFWKKTYLTQSLNRRERKYIKKIAIENNKQFNPRKNETGMEPQKIEE